MRGIIATAIVATSQANELEFMKYVAQWNKSYGTMEEFEFRRARWTQVDSFVNQVNAPGSDFTHTAGHNHFSTWTEKEFESMMNQ